MLLFAFPWYYLCHIVSTIHVHESLYTGRYYSRERNENDFNKHLSHSQRIISNISDISLCKSWGGITLSKWQTYSYKIKWILLRCIYLSAIHAEDSLWSYTAAFCSQCILATLDSHCYNHYPFIVVVPLLAEDKIGKVFNWIEKKWNRKIWITRWCLPPSGQVW